MKDMEIVKISNITFNASTYYFGYLMPLTRSSVIKELADTKNILYQQPKWEQLRKNGVFQCKNCQRLGHANGNCSLPS